MTDPLELLFESYLPMGAPARLLEQPRGVQRFVDAGRGAWPELSLDGALFVKHVAERSQSGVLPNVAVAEDLYLACACAHGVPGAHEAFERRYGELIERSVSRKNSDPTFVSDVVQSLRERLFVSATGSPKIADYGGRAALATWLTITASRAALMQLRGETRRRESSEAEDVPGAEVSPELLLLKRKYAPYFAAALAAAFGHLSDKEKTLLQLNTAERLSVDGLAELYKVGRSTAARWLAAARERLVDETQKRLRDELGLSASEYDSLAVLVRSQLDVSVLAFLRDR